ncbi:hypothetical protein ACHAPT_000169 [Fusarium lateritium]
MEVALTFGSLGDIIQLCQLAIQLGKAVGGAAGGESAKEYQELGDDLDSFVRILMQVVETYESHESSHYLEGLDHASRCVVNQTASLIQDALDHFQSRYKNCLHPGGSGSKVKDVYKKLEWSTREKGRTQCLREKLQESTQRLALLTSLAARKSARVNNATLLARVAKVEELVSQSCTSQEELLHLIQQQQKASQEQVQKLDQASQLLVKQDKTSRSILAVAGEALDAIVQVKDLLVQVSHDVINIHVVFDSMCLRSMDPITELPAVIEDALGRRALYALLSGHFRGQNGHGMVMRREYVLEESASGRDLDPERPLHLCLRRGMKIHMSMIFQTPWFLPGACPRCMTKTDAPRDVTVQCPRPDCGMLFRVQQAVVGDSDQEMLLTDGEFDTEPTTMTVASTSAKPADFRRVRLFRQNYEPSRPSRPSASAQNNVDIDALLDLTEYENASNYQSPSGSLGPLGREERVLM